MYDVLIVGGGASGLAAACALAEPGRLRVAVLEKQPRVGRKLLSTGNGRCNLTMPLPGTITVRAARRRVR